jgi:8-oxo-dGTP pyrophosphatase MutT (NUDIX family)
MPKGLPIEHPVSAGGVVYRWGERGLEILLCGQKQPLTWRLPKGTPNRGEKLEETAKREVEEETGLKVKVEGKIGRIDYWFVQQGVRYHKLVYFFLMSPCGGDIALHDPEFDMVTWFPIDEACNILTYKNEVTILRQAQTMVSQH